MARLMTGTGCGSETLRRMHFMHVSLVQVTMDEKCALLSLSKLYAACRQRSESAESSV